MEDHQIQLCSESHSEFAIGRELSVMDDSLNGVDARDLGPTSPLCSAEISVMPSPTSELSSFRKTKSEYSAE